MALTPAQLATLKAAILADPTLNAQPMTADGAFAIAQALNQLAAPSFVVWRTDVTRAQIYHTTSAEATTWEWNTYKNQSQGEQGAWLEMFSGDQANFGLANLRGGVAKIFSGSAGANAQRDHCYAIAKRSATRVEKLFATGTGTLIDPATMTFEGALAYQDVETARALP